MGDFDVLGGEQHLAAAEGHTVFGPELEDNVGNHRGVVGGNVDALVVLRIGGVLLDVRGVGVFAEAHLDVGVDGVAAEEPVRDFDVSAALDLDRPLLHVRVQFRRQDQLHVRVALVVEVHLQRLLLVLGADQLRAHFHDRLDFAAGVGIDHRQPFVFLGVVGVVVVYAK